MTKFVKTEALENLDSPDSCCICYPYLSSSRFLCKRWAHSLIFTSWISCGSCCRASKHLTCVIVFRVFAHFIKWWTWIWYTFNFLKNWTFSTFVSLILHIMNYKKKIFKKFLYILYIYLEIFLTPPYNNMM